MFKIKNNFNNQSQIQTEIARRNLPIPGSYSLQPTVFEAKIPLIVFCLNSACLYLVCIVEKKNQKNALSVNIKRTLWFW